MAWSSNSVGYPGRYHLVTLDLCLLFDKEQKTLSLIIVISIFGLFLHINRPLPVQSSTTLRQSHHMSTEDCQCVHRDSSTGNDSHKNYIIKLHRPWHHFDSNHWFHSKCHEISLCPSLYIPSSLSLCLSLCLSLSLPLSLPLSPPRSINVVLS
jgi:hypothetical protein